MLTTNIQVIAKIKALLFTQVTNLVCFSLEDFKLSLHSSNFKPTNKLVLEWSLKYEFHITLILKNSILLIASLKIPKLCLDDKNIEC